MGLKVGFVGLGKMGLPMLEKLARSPDLELKAFDLSNAAFETLAEHPAWQRSLFRARSLEDFSTCDIVITMLPDSTATRAVIDGRDGAAGIGAILGAGTIIVDMGSSDPASTMEMGRALRARDITFFDAPVSGSVPKARSGELSIMLGGADDPAAARIMPILSLVGSKIIPTGALGSAHAMKALNNYVYAAGLLAVSEAAMIGRAMDLDLEILADVIDASSGRNVASETKLRQYILSQRYCGGFALRLMAKDLRTAAGLQQLAGRDAPQLALCNSLWAEAEHELPAFSDNTEIHRFLEKRGQAREEEERADQGSKAIADR